MFGCGGEAFAVPPSPIYTWTGFYLGGHIGAGWDQTTFFDPGAKIPFFGMTQSIAPEGAGLGLNSGGGALVGVQGGYNYQFANNWVIGFNGSYSWMNLNGFGVDPYFDGKFGRPITFGTRTDALGSFSGRFGYAWNNAFIYGSGGVAWAHNSYNFNNLGALGNMVCLLGCDAVGGATRTGWTAGVGVEYGFTPYWSAFVQYDHYGFDTKNIIFTSRNVPGADASFGVKESIDTIKAGVNYHFDFRSPQW
jgi:outer membrane immunogenic protein